MSGNKVALITGITGQDGSYLAEYLLHQGYEVHGIIRRASTFNTFRIDHIYKDPHEPSTKLFLHYGDLADAEQVSNLVHKIRPREIYNLAAQSHVRVSFEMPEYTGNVDALGTTRILEAVRRTDPSIKLYQAASSEMFGSSPPPQNEKTPFRPRSPYAIAKLYAHWMTVNYREAYKLPAWIGILFNHESPRRGEIFVSRKITRAIAAILAKKQHIVYLGNLEARRDWGYAPEYVEFMHKMLQTEDPEDFVLGTGESHTVNEFVQEAFGYCGLNPERHVQTEDRYLRPTEPAELLADPSKAKTKLKWDPKIKFHELVKIMVDADLHAAGLEPPGEGEAIIQKRFPNRWWRVS
jgi:GDPmannose 4,6-dehydratase